jgi:hypothetical protein
MDRKIAGTCKRTVDRQTDSKKPRHTDELPLTSSPIPAAYTTAVFPPVGGGGGGRPDAVAGGGGGGLAAAAAAGGAGRRA